MSMKELIAKYTACTEQVLGEMTVANGSTSTSSHDVNKVVEYARAYLNDAKYYEDKRKLAISLTSIAYAEGLLDALRLIGAVKFEWPTGRRAENERRF